MHNSETGLPIELYLNGTTLAEAYVQGHVGDPNFLVFTIEINDATGALTLTVLRGLVDPTPGTQEDLVQAASDVLFVTAENNGVTVSFDLGPHLTLVDDAPTVTGEAATLQVDEDGLANGNTDTGQTGEADLGGPLTDDFDLTTVFSIGADQPGTYQFTSGADVRSMGSA